MRNYYDEIMNLIHNSPFIDFEYVRDKFKKMMRKFKPYMDSHFENEIKNSNDYDIFHQRFFELYMSNYLLENNIQFNSYDKGPDFILKNKTHIECVAPTAGKGQNKVDERPIFSSEKKNNCCNVPEEKIMLRLSSAIFDKYKKYRKYIKSEVIDSGVNIIALNDGLIPYSKIEDNIPRIIKVLFGIGYQVVNFDKPDKFQVSKRDYINKYPETKINMNFFNNDKYKEISAIIYTSAEISDLENKLGFDFKLIKNPYAKNMFDEKSININFESVYEVKGGEIISKNE